MSDAKQFLESEDLPTLIGEDLVKITEETLKGLFSVLSETALGANVLEVVKLTWKKLPQETKTAIESKITCEVWIAFCNMALAALESYTLALASADALPANLKEEASKIAAEKEELPKESSSATEG